MAASGLSRRDLASDRDSAYPSGDPGRIAKANEIRGQGWPHLDYKRGLAFSISTSQAGAAIPDGSHQQRQKHPPRWRCTSNDLEPMVQVGEPAPPSGFPHEADMHTGW
jgi:hypothetical protein